METGKGVQAMSFGERLRRRREEKGMTQQQLARQLGISKSAVGNYETGVSMPREDVLLRLFSALDAEPNYLFQDSFRPGGGVLSSGEQRLVQRYRALTAKGKAAVTQCWMRWRKSTPVRWLCCRRLDRRGAFRCLLRPRRRAMLLRCWARNTR